MKRVLMCLIFLQNCSISSQKKSLQADNPQAESALTETQSTQPTAVSYTNPSTITQPGTNPIVNSILGLVPDIVKPGIPLPPNLLVSIVSQMIPAFIGVEIPISSESALEALGWDDEPEELVEINEIIASSDDYALEVVWRPGGSHFIVHSSKNTL